MKNFNVSSLIRDNIRQLKPYSSARDEFKGDEGIFLDANENPYGELNRYPDPHQKQLKKALSELKEISESNIFIGNGSDEVIDLIYRIFAQPGRDSVVICPPTYGMYEVSANINDVKVVNIPLTSDFQLDIDKLLGTVDKNTSIKLIFICSPNNPTGNRLDNIDILVENFNGIVVLDEAYIDFCPDSSFLDKLSLFPNLIISQTLSKAWGLAGVRIGIAYASSEIISIMDKTKPPYNVSKLNQRAAINTLSDKVTFKKNRSEILSQKEWLRSELSKLKCVKKLYPSDANFILIEVTDALKIYNELVSSHVIVRNRSSQISNCLRITVGSPSENAELISALNKLKV